MLTEQEYNELLPHKELIERFRQTGSYKGGALGLIDQIRQRRGWGALCFSCDGSKANALNDAMNMLEEYEQYRNSKNI